MKEYGLYSGRKLPQINLKQNKVLVKTIFTFKENLKSSLYNYYIRFGTCVVRFKVVINFKYF